MENRASVLSASRNAYDAISQPRNKRRSHSIGQRSISKLAEAVAPPAANCAGMKNGASVLSAGRNAYGGGISQARNKSCSPAIRRGSISKLAESIAPPTENGRVL
jgi:hypothetical protein